MTSLLNFLVGGGLLALVQAALSAWAAIQAKQLGAAQVTVTEQHKVIDDVQGAKAVDGHITASSDSAVADELRQFQRD